MQAGPEARRCNLFEPEARRYNLFELEARRCNQFEPEARRCKGAISGGGSAGGQRVQDKILYLPGRAELPLCPEFGRRGSAAPPSARFHILAARQRRPTKREVS